MAVDAKLTACRDWIVSALPTLVDVLILRSPFADAPRPAAPTFPYAAIAWSADVPLSGTPYEEQTDEWAGGGVDPGPGPGNPNEFYARRWQRRRRTLQVRFYGDELAWDLASTLRITLRRNEIQAIFKLAGLSAVVLSEPADASVQRDSAWETIVLQDYGIFYVVADFSKVAIIETVTLKLNGTDYPVLA